MRRSKHTVHYFDRSYYFYLLYFEIQRNISNNCRKEARENKTAQGRYSNVNSNLLLMYCACFKISLTLHGDYTGTNLKTDNKYLTNWQRIIITTNMLFITCLFT